MNKYVFTVSEVNQYIKSVFQSDILLSHVYIRGEISNFKAHSSGHKYMTLKDAGASIRAVMFKTEASRLKFKLEDGMRVIVEGRVDSYVRDGQYQMYISDVIPEGVGAMHVALEQLKEKLAAEGLFAQEHKKPLPEYPSRIALVTSETGSVIRDMTAILGARYPICEVTVYSVAVQGDRAAAEITKVIEQINREKLCDIIIVGRGGGSIEDLWAFNDEALARAIYNSEIAVISAVGHEPDYTIADFVADVRAATPSNAAELAVPDMLALKSDIAEFAMRLSNAEKQLLHTASARLEDIRSRTVFLTPESYFTVSGMRLESLKNRLAGAMNSKIANTSDSFGRMAAKLDVLSPLKVLSRGYAIATHKEVAIRSVKTLDEGDNICVRFSDGRINCTVKEVEKNDV